MKRHTIALPLGEVFALTVALRQLQAYEMSVSMGLRTERNARTLTPAAEGFEQRRNAVLSMHGVRHDRPGETFMLGEMPLYDSEPARQAARELIEASREIVEHELEPYTEAELEMVTRLMGSNGNMEIVHGLTGSLTAALMPLVLAEEGG